MPNAGEIRIFVAELFCDAIRFLFPAGLLISHRGFLQGTRRDRQDLVVKQCDAHESFAGFFQILALELHIARQ